MTYDLDEKLLQRIIDMIKKCARLLDPGEEVLPERPLREVGVDSFGLVDLLVMLEDELDIVLPDDLLTPEMFESAATIAVAVTSVLTAG